MKGHAEVIQVLNDVLSAELTAINQYFIHGEMCGNWRYMRLAKHSRQESIEEMKHAEQLIERILYLEGVPNMQKYMRINVGQDVPAQHTFDLDLERDAVSRLNKGIETCRARDDNGSRLLLEKILHDEEGHIDWLEAQFQQIKDMGLENYLAQQIEG
ncbi:MAG TPA: bacterioferritin [Vicinamibacteria bacterium]|jgi:bacterioferritin